MAEFPSCTACHRKFSLNSPAPFLLPCLHAVCETCTTTAAGGVISCSPCQRDVNLTETPLQKDVVREKEIFHLTVQRHPEQVLCTHEEDGNQAVCRCKDCDAFLCENCYTQHEAFRANRKHSIQKLVDLEPGAAEYEYCGVHRKYPLDTWDRSCQITICSRCQREDHRDHEVEDSGAAVEGSQQFLSHLDGEFTALIENCDSQVDDAGQKLSSSKKAYDEVMENIKGKFLGLKLALQKRLEHMLLATNQRNANVVADLIERQRTANLEKTRCEVITDYIRKTLTYAPKNALPPMKTIFQRIPQSSLKGQKVVEQQRSLLSPFCDEGFIGLRSALSSFGDSSTGEEISIFNEQDNERENEAAVVITKKTLKSMTAKIGDLEKEMNSKTARIGELESAVEDMRKQLEDNNIEAAKLLSGRKELLVKSEASVSKLTSERDTHLKMIGEKETCLAGLYKQGVNMTSYIVDKRYLLQRPPIVFDKERVNLQQVSLNAEEELVNTIIPDSGTGANSFHNYWGTCSSLPLPLNESSCYFEVKTKTSIDTVLTGHKLVLEVGLVQQEEQDKHHSLDQLSTGCCLSVRHCTEHRSICTMIWKHGHHVLCSPRTLDNKPESSATLHFGVASDVDKERLAFLDIGSMKVIAVLDKVDVSKHMWPMFGVYCRDVGTVKMALVTGWDICMTDEKTALLRRFLSR